MKLSSRKKLLEDAKHTLKEINSSISNDKTVNEIDWELHKKGVSNISRDRPNISRFIEFLAIKRLGEIEKKYESMMQSGKYTEEDKNREINEILEYLKKYKEHLLSGKRIPEDPQKQTELQKAIVNTPKVEGWLKNTFQSPMIKDPETGFWWNADLGFPSPHGPITTNLPAYLPPKTEEDKKAREYLEFLVDAGFHGMQWDSSRSWFYNVLNKLGKSFIFGG